MPTSAADATTLLDELAARRDWPAAGLDALRDLVGGRDERALFRINPIRFAEEHGISPREATALFLHAAAVGLFELTWGVICRGCGAVVESFRTLARVNDHFFCPDCNRDRESTLDDAIDVSFTIAPEVRPIRFHDPTSLPLEEYFFESYFGHDILLRDTGQPFVRYLRDTRRILAEVAARGELTVDVDLPHEGWLVGSPRHMVTVTGRDRAAEPRELTLVLSEDGIFEPHGETVRPGVLRLTLVNPHDRPRRVFSYLADRVPYFAYRPFLSGKGLLNDPVFRELFKEQLVTISSGIAVRDITLMFTDLRGSTAFYDRVGDPRAFELVTQHFRRVGDVVGIHGGAIVKTIGDAVMAAFDAPADGVRAALAVLRDMATFNQGDGGGDFVLKLGLHRGPSIAVTVNDSVDYFGQTANVAARVQGCAQGEEICLSEAVYSDPEVAKLLSEFGDVPEEDVHLRGLAEATRIRRLRPTARR